MKPGYKTLFLLATLATCLARLPAQASSLADALEHAWTRHPQATALDARISEAKAHAEMAAALTPGPAALSLGHLNDTLGSNRGKREWEVELAVPLWLPGQKNLQAVHAASIQHEIDTHRAALRLELAGELRSAWWSLAAARQSNDLAQRRQNSARTLEADVMRRYQAGDLARVDANHARSERLAAQSESMAAANALRHAEAAWRGLTGLAAPIQLDAETPAKPSESGAEHPALAALTSTVQVANARLRQVQSSTREAPEIAVRLQRERERGDSGEAYGNSIGVQLTIPFTSGPRQRRDNAAALAVAHQAEAMQLRASQRLLQSIEQARLELDMAQQQWSLAQARQEFAADTLALAEKSFSLGEADLPLLLRARTAAFEAEAVLNRQATARGQANAQLKQALGQMP